MKRKLMEKQCSFCPNKAFYYEDDEDENTYRLLCDSCQAEEQACMEAMTAKWTLTGVLLHRLLNPTITEVNTPGQDPYGGERIEFKFLGLKVIISTVVSPNVLVTWWDTPQMYNMVDDTRQMYTWPDRLLRYNSGFDILIGGTAKWIFDKLMEYNQWWDSIHYIEDGYGSLSSYE